MTLTTKNLYARFEEENYDVVRYRLVLIIPTTTHDETQ